MHIFCSILLLIYAFLALNFPIYSADVGFILQQKHYDFIFGWSTGHVGTTSLSESRLYGHPQGVSFLHETHFGQYSIEDHKKMTVEKWKNSTYNDEYTYVKNVYMPFIIKSKGRNKTLVDLGHNNMFFIKPLLDYLISESTFRFILVRVRRERIESALSLTYSSPHKQHEMICKGLHFRYCPFDRPADIILKVPSRSVWANFSQFQKALWMLDEVEARWNKFLVNYPEMDTMDVLWGKSWPGSFDAAAMSIAKLLNITHIISFDAAWAVTHTHAGEEWTEISDPTYARMDRSYRQAMGYKYLPG